MDSLDVFGAVVVINSNISLIIYVTKNVDTVTYSLMGVKTNFKEGAQTVEIYLYKRKLRKSHHLMAMRKI